MVKFRKMRESDWIDIHHYACQEIVCQHQQWGPNTQEESNEYVRQALADEKKEPRNRYVFAVVEENGGKVIGTGEIHISDFANRTGEIGYIIHPDYWGRGFATTTAKYLIQFGFEKLKLHRIYATCDPRNIGSVKVLEKTGMSREGRIRENFFVKGSWRDSYIYSMLEHEWTDR